MTPVGTGPGGRRRAHRRAPAARRPARRLPGCWRSGSPGTRSSRCAGAGPLRQRARAPGRRPGAAGRRRRRLRRRPDRRGHRARARPGPGRGRRRCAPGSRSATSAPGAGSAGATTCSPTGLLAATRHPALRAAAWCRPRPAAGRLRGRGQPAREAGMSPARRGAGGPPRRGRRDAIGTTPKAAVHHADTPLHLAFSCYLFDDGRPAADDAARPAQADLAGRVDQQRLRPPRARASRSRTPYAAACSTRSACARRASRLMLPAFRYRAVMPNGVVENEMCPVFVASTGDDLAPEPGRGGRRDLGRLGGVPRRGARRQPRDQPVVP